MLKRNVVANLSGQFLQGVVGFALVPLYVHYLGIGGYGVIGALATLQATMGLLDAGMTPTVTRELARHSASSTEAHSARSTLHTAEAFAAIIGFSLATAIWAASPLLAVHWFDSGSYSPESLSEALRACGLIVGLRFLEGIYRGALAGLQRQVATNIIGVSASSVRALGAVLLLWLMSASIVGLLYWFVAVAAASTFVHALAAYRLLPRSSTPAPPSFATFRQMRTFANGMVANTLLSTALTQVDKVILVHYLDIEKYGYYMLASTAASAIHMLVIPITGAYFPRLSNLYASRSQIGFTQTFHQGAQLVCAVAGSCAVVCCLFSWEVIFVWTDRSDTADFSADLLSVLAAAACLNAISQMPYLAQLAAGWTTHMIKVNICLIVLAVPAVVVCAGSLGGLGAAIVWFAVNVVYVFVAIPLMFRRLLTRESTHWLRLDVLFPISAAIAMALLTRALTAADPTRIGTVITLVLVTVGCIFAATVAAPALRSSLAVQSRSHRRHE